MEEILPSRGGENCVSDNSKCIREWVGGGGVTSNFLHGGGMDVFWNDLTESHGVRVKYRSRAHLGWVI